MACRCYSSPPVYSLGTKEPMNEQNLNSDVETKAKADLSQQDKSILEYVERDSDDSPPMASQSLQIENETSQNTVANTNPISYSNNTESMEDEIENKQEPFLEDSMECENGTISFSECPDIPWNGSEVSDVVYTFSEYG